MTYHSEPIKGVELPSMEDKIDILQKEFGKDKERGIVIVGLGSVGTSIGAAVSSVLELKNHANIIVIDDLKKEVQQNQLDYFKQTIVKPIELINEKVYILPSKSGKENRRERRKQERKNKKRL